jgi:hypothetical protein
VTRFPRIVAIRRSDSELDSMCHGREKVVEVETNGCGGLGRCNRCQRRPVSKLGLWSWRGFIGGSSREAQGGGAGGGMAGAPPRL